MACIGRKRRGRPGQLCNHHYSAPGTYFLTLCSWGRLQVFGKCAPGTVQLSEWGCIVQEEWLRTPHLRPSIRLDAYVIMPDHLHGIVVWDRDDPRLLWQPQSVASLVTMFKAICTRRINELRMSSEPPVWQADYYEHVVQNRRALERIRRYVLSNPSGINPQSEFAARSL